LDELVPEPIHRQFLLFMPIQFFEIRRQVMTHGAVADIEACGDRFIIYIP